MNDANIKYYLEQQMRLLNDEIETLYARIDTRTRSTDDDLQRIALLKVHYTSLLNTAIAYGYEKEEEE
jgi:hypothetical protein